MKALYRRASEVGALIANPWFRDCLKARFAGKVRLWYGLNCQLPRRKL
jgi:hypothetical protein